MDNETKQTLGAIQTYIALCGDDRCEFDDSWEHLFDEIDRLLKLGFSKQDVVAHFYQVTHDHIGSDESIDIERAVEDLIRTDFAA